MKGKIICICNTCNTVFLNPKLLTNYKNTHNIVNQPQLYCSDGCRNIEKTCRGCGIKFKQHYFKDGRPSPRDTCRKCYGVQLRGAQTIINGMKKCSLCNILMDVDLFSNSKTNRSGKNSACRECRSIEFNKYYKKPANKKRIERVRKERETTTEFKERRNELQRDNRRTSPKRRLNDAISRSMRLHLEKRGGSKNGWSWSKILGYTIDDLTKHLEKQFTDGMTLENFGEWQIDHIIPVSKLNFSNTTHLDFMKCYALSNLQPLWAVDNRSKSNKLEKPFQPSLQL